MSLIVHIRRAKPSDIPTIIEYNLAHAKEIEGLQLNEDVLRLGVENALKRKECHYFVAESDGNVIGQTMITYEWSDWRNGVIWWLQSIYVKPDYRKQGVFKAIFHHIETLAKNDPQIKALRLYVMKNNQSGKSAYKKLGMNNSNYIVYDKEFFIDEFQVGRWV